MTKNQEKITDLDVESMHRLASKQNAGITHCCHHGDVLDIINDGWELMIAHPPCTHLAVSGARWFKSKLKEAVIKC